MNFLSADFEGENYGNWEVTGDAFGTTPKWRETETMEEIRGFEGSGLASSSGTGMKRKELLPLRNLQ